MITSMNRTPDQRRAALLQFMKRRGFSHVKPFATAAGVGESTIRGFLSGRADSLSQRILEKLATGHGTSVAELIGEAMPAEEAVLPLAQPEIEPRPAATDDEKLMDRLCVIINQTVESRDAVWYASAHEAAMQLARLLERAMRSEDTKDPPQLVHPRLEPPRSPHDA